MSISFYDKIAMLVHGTFAETVINTFISDGFRSNPIITAAQRRGDTDGVLGGILETLRLPEGVSDAIFKKPENITTLDKTELFGDIDIIGHFSTQATRAVIAIACVIALYAVIRVLISIAKIFLDEIASLKLFRMFNFIGGPVIGLVEGIVTVYIALALLMLVNIVIQFEPINQLIEASRFARGMYDNNYFLDFVLGRV
jgi:hypothetical protein